MLVFRNHRVWHNFVSGVSFALMHNLRAVKPAQAAYQLKLFFCFILKDHIRVVDVIFFSDCWDERRKKVCERTLLPWQLVAEKEEWLVALATIISGLLQTGNALLA